MPDRTNRHASRVQQRTASRHASRNASRISITTRITRPAAPSCRTCTADWALRQRHRRPTAPPEPAATHALPQNTFEAAQNRCLRGVVLVQDGSVRRRDAVRLRPIHRVSSCRLGQAAVQASHHEKPEHPSPKLVPKTRPQNSSSKFIPKIHPKNTPHRPGGRAYIAYSSWPDLQLDPTQLGANTNRLKLAQNQRPPHIIHTHDPGDGTEQPQPAPLITPAAKTGLLLLCLHSVAARTPRARPRWLRSSTTTWPALPS